MTATAAPLVTWDDSWLVGVREIDAQHHNLVNLLNQLHHEMTRGKGREVMGSVLDSLIRYTKEHFADEERLLEQHAYPDRAAHKRQHVALTEKVVAFQREFQTGGVLSIEVLEFLKEWLRGHIRGTDTKYVSLLHTRGVR